MVAASTPGRSGYQLATYPGCTERYLSGPYLGLNLFVVALGDPENERIFNRKELPEADAYSKSFGFYMPLVQVSTVETCKRAVEDAYARL